MISSEKISVFIFPLSFPFLEGEWTTPSTVTYFSGYWKTFIFIELGKLEGGIWKEDSTRRPSLCGVSLERTCPTRPLGPKYVLGGETPVSPSVRRFRRHRPRKTVSTRVSCSRFFRFFCLTGGLRRPLSSVVELKSGFSVQESLDILLFTHRD